MTTVLTYTDPATKVALTDLAGSAPTLKNLTNGAYILNNETDPGAAPAINANYRLDIRATTPTKGIVAKCWYITDVGDDGVYDITDGTNTPSRAPDFVFYGYAITTQQRLHSTPRILARPACPFKILFQNTSGANYTNVDAENVLYESTYSELQT